MGTDATGLVLYGGNAVLSGESVFDEIYSDYGSAVGIHLMSDATFEMESEATLNILAESIKSGVSLDADTIHKLMASNKCPYPNNFYEANVMIGDNCKQPSDTVTLDIHGVTDIFCRMNALAQSLAPTQNVPVSGSGTKHISNTQGMWVYNRYKWKTFDRKSHSSSSSSSHSSSSSNEYDMRDRYRW